MAEPSEKSPAITTMLDRLYNRSNCIKNNVCTICAGPAIKFRDRISQKEYTISGMCQTCQDSVFGGNDES
jgi:hypothetical protein